MLDSGCIGSPTWMSEPGAMPAFLDMLLTDFIIYYSYLGI